MFDRPLKKHGDLHMFQDQMSAGLSKFHFDLKINIVAHWIPCLRHVTNSCVYYLNQTSIKDLKQINKNSMTSCLTCAWLEYKYAHFDLVYSISHPSVLNMTWSWVTFYYGVGLFEPIIYIHAFMRCGLLQDTSLKFNIEDLIYICKIWNKYEPTIFLN